MPKVQVFERSLAWHLTKQEDLAHVKSLVNKILITWTSEGKQFELRMARG